LLELTGDVKVTILLAYNNHHNHATVKDFVFQSRSSSRLFDFRKIAVFLSSAPTYAERHHQMDMSCSLEGSGGAFAQFVLQLQHQCPRPYTETALLQHPARVLARTNCITSFSAHMTCNLCS